MASHESDQIKVPPNHATEDANWAHERSRWKCKINGYDALPSPGVNPLEGSPKR